jgi:hypothetical protein
MLSKSGVALAGACALALASCGVGPSHTLNPKSVQAQIAHQLESRYPVKGVVVNCPASIPADRVGTTFTCTAGIDGQTLRLLGTVTSSKGLYSIEPAEAIVSTAQAASTLQSDISANVHSTVSVDCGPLPVRVVPVNGQFACQVSIAGQGARQATVTVEDLNGHFHYSLAAAGA